MNKGFLSFVLGAVFLLAIVSSGVLISGAQPGYSYERFRASLVQEVAIKQAYYQAISESASSALNFSLAAKADPQRAIEASALAQTLSFESQLRLRGYDAIFWCGAVSEQQRQQASEQMASQAKAVAPAGSLPAAACAESFEANLLSRKVHIYDVGFSVYFPELQIGRAALFPPSYEVGF